MRGTVRRETVRYVMVSHSLPILRVAYLLTYMTKRNTRCNMEMQGGVDTKPSTAGPKAVPHLRPVSLGSAAAQLHHVLLRLPLQQNPCHDHNSLREAVPHSTFRSG